MASAEPATCPVGFGSKKSEAPLPAVLGSAEGGGASSACPLGHTSQPTPLPAVLGSADGAGTSSACPLGHTSQPAPERRPGEQAPAPAATDALSRERVQSSIPSSTGEPFMYPSEKQFYGSAVAKGHDNI